MAKKELKLNYNTFATKHSKDYYRGQSFHFSGEWLVGAHYLSDDYNVDFVVHDHVLLACAKSHLSNVENEPKDFIRDESGTVVGVVSIYWDFVLAGIMGNSPGIKIIDNYWYVCNNVGVPEEEQIWVNTNVKAKMELSDLTPSDIELLQRPGKEVVTEFVNTTITQELGNDPEKILSQAGVTDALNSKASISQLSAAISNEVLRADTAYQPKGDYATNTRVSGLSGELQFFESQANLRFSRTENSISNLASHVNSVESSIPTKVSQLQNDSQYQTKDNLDSRLSPIEDIIPQEANISNKLADKSFVINKFTNNNIVNALGYTPLNAALKGANNGVAELDENGLVVSSQLPSYVDDVLEYSSINQFPVEGESGKIYVDTTTNLTYRWSGSVYTEISASLALGENNSTAYRGDRGKIAYDHATDGTKINSAVNNGFYKIGSTSEGHIESLVAVSKEDITNFNLNKSDVGLSNVDNTSDINKPISTATQEALNSKLEGVKVNNEELPVTSNTVNIDLTGKVNVAESVIVDDAFISRPVGKELTIDAKNAQIINVAGKSVKWNQMVYNAQAELTLPSGSSSDRILSFKDREVPNGNKVYIACDVKITSDFNDNSLALTLSNGGNTYGGSLSFTSVTKDNTYYHQSDVVTSADDRNKNLYVRYSNHSAGSISIKNVIAINLTAIFGAGNEPTTVAAFESWLAQNVGLQNYYPYDEGSVLNNKMKGIETIGFNLLDPATGKARIVGAYSDVYGNYYGITGTHGALTFTSDLGEVSTITPDSDGKFLIETPGWLAVADAGADCAVFLWWDGTKTEYEDYEHNEAPLDVTHIYGKLNGAGNLVQVWPTGMPAIGDLKDTLKIVDGAVVAERKCGEVDMGANSWDAVNASIGVFRLGISEKRVPHSMSDVGELMCAKYVANTGMYQNSSVMVDKTMQENVSSPTWVMIKDTAFNDNTGAQVATALSGQRLYYGLETPKVYSDLVYQGSSLFADGTPVELFPLYTVNKYGTEHIVPQGLDSNNNIQTCAANLKIAYYEANVQDVNIEGIDKYVKKSDLTSDLNKLSNVESGAQVNVIEKIQINGTDQTITNKTVNLPAYPTTLPASDVSAWAKDTSKPSYTLDEVTDGSTRKLANYLPLSGGEMSNTNLVTNLNADLLDGKHNGELTAEDTKIELKSDQEFIFRKTNVDWNANAACLNGIKGKSLVWNQLVKNVIVGSNNGVTLVQNANGSFTLNGTAEANTVLRIKTGIPAQTNTNKILVCHTLTDQSASTYFLQNPNNSGLITSGQIITNWLYDNTISVVIKSGVEVNKTFFVQAFNLTLMFGAGNEPSTVEEFEAMFPENYYEYNSGEIISSNINAIETTGFNQWDEEWELGAINNTTGGNLSENNRIRSKNYIPVIPGQTYYCYYGNDSSSTHLYVYWYDANKNYLVTVSVGGKASGARISGSTFVIPPEVRYIRFCSYGGTLTTYAHDICINLSDTNRNGTYEPYKKSTLSLNISTLTGKLNGEGESVIICSDGLKSAGSVYDYGIVEDGYLTKIVKVIGEVVIDGTTYVMSGTPTTDYEDANRFNFGYANDTTIFAVNSPYLSDKFLVVANSYDPQPYTLLNTSSASANRAWFFFPKSIDTNAAANAWFASNPTTLYFKLATPKTYVLDTPIPVSYFCNKFGTERILPEGVDENGIPKTTPFVADIQYGLAQKDLLNYISENSDNINKLQSTKTLWGQPFNGTSNVSGSLSNVTDITASGVLSGNAFNVITQHIVDLTSRIETLESNIDKANELYANSVNVRNSYKIAGDNCILWGSEVPSTAPNFVGQFYIDTLNKKLYFATGKSSISDWNML